MVTPNEKTFAQRNKRHKSRLSSRSPPSYFVPRSLPTRRISTMLPFYFAFLISVLSSSVIARQEVGETKLLIGNPDDRLSTGVWAEAKLSSPGTGRGWSKDRYLDHVILLERGTSGVAKVTLSRIARRFTLAEVPKLGEPVDPIKNTYRVVRSHYGKNKRPADTLRLLGPLQIGEGSRSFLDNTYWIRNWLILGNRKSGLKDQLQNIIHIQWKPNAENANVEEPYVTFMSAEQLNGKIVLKAEESYDLDGEEITRVNAGCYVWPAERRRPPGYYQQDLESELLLYNHDLRLLDGLWARAEFSASASGATTWAQARVLDDVIRFKSGTWSGVVERVNLYIINRELISDDRRRRGQGLHSKYPVRRPEIHPEGCPYTIPPTEPFDLELDLAIDSSGPYLHDTYWARIPEILGSRESGPETDWEQIIHIRWVCFYPHQEAVPFVTFIPEHRCPGHVVKAKEYYELEGEELRMVADPTRTMSWQF